MKQTPLHAVTNKFLLDTIPENVKSVVDVGCMAGQLARDLKLKHPSVNVLGIDIDQTYLEYAKAHCDDTLHIDFDSVANEFYDQFSDVDCWVFADSLEHLKDPYSVVSNIFRVAKPGAYLIASVPNVQHWTIIKRLLSSDFRYEDSNLLDRTHLRWFCRASFCELFLDRGFLIDDFKYLFNYELPVPADFCNSLKAAGSCFNLDPLTLETDLYIWQYLIRARKP